MELPASALARRASQQLELYAESYGKTAPRRRVTALVEINRTLRLLGKHVSDDFLGGRVGARRRLATYLKAHPYEIIDGEELAIVAGISEYARRLRELRARGLDIVSGRSERQDGDLQLKPDQYIYRPLKD